MPGADQAICSLSPLRFICDEMLRGVGGWLRLAGYDTLLPAPGEDDAALLARAHDENRWLITRDRGFGQRAGAPHYLIFLESASLEDNLLELSGRLNIDWLRHPFSRCKQCNTLLQADVAPQSRHRVPQDITQGHALLRFCPRCDQFFWFGGHARRMIIRLGELNGKRAWNENV